MRVAITTLVLAGFALLIEGLAQRTGRDETQGEHAKLALKEQLNEIIDTRDSPQGLTVTVPDLFFDTGKATLTTVAQERLAKAGQILAGHPGVRIEVNGYTDNEGDARSQQELSQGRADSAKSILAQQGVPASAISAHGLGDANPVASNETAAGRQQNRRVELVVSGDSIGTQATSAR
jgi:outer membrane protein OmpA-like peptidoglycan-associated protein